MKSTTSSADFDFRTLRAMQITGALLTLGLIVVAFAAGGSPMAEDMRLTQAAIGVMVSLSAAACGGMLGFLFGLRRAPSVPAPAAGSGESSGNHALAYNTSLEQVVDWLTKILIGAGLTQIAEIKRQLLRLSEAVGQCVPVSEGDGSWIFWLAVLAYFGAVGFQGGYLATRLVLNRMLVLEEKNLGDLAESTALMLSSAAINRQTDESRYLALKGDTSLTEAFGWQPATPVTNLEDPQKGRFGGQPASSDGRLKLSATVQPLGGPDGELFSVSLRVESLVPKVPLSGPVKFFLHSTYSPDNAVIVPQLGSPVCLLELIAWGAFTVGAMADGGKTLLELDLASLDSAPKKFRER